MLDLNQQETLELLFRVDGIATEDEPSDTSDINFKIEEEFEL